MIGELYGVKNEAGDVLEVKPDKWAFLRSTRFYAMILTAIAVYLSQKGFIGEAEMQLLATITTGFVAIRTVDRFSDKE